MERDIAATTSRVLGESRCTGLGAWKAVGGAGGTVGADGTADVVGYKGWIDGRIVAEKVEFVDPICGKLAGVLKCCIEDDEIGD